MCYYSIRRDKSKTLHSARHTAVGVVPYGHMRIVHFIAFAALNFLPVAIGVVLFLPLLVINIFVSTETEWKLVCFILIFIIILIPLGSAYLCYRLCSRYKSWVSRCIIIYSTWLVLAFMSGYVISASLGGASMAVVDGVVERGDMIWQEMVHSGWILLMIQIFIIPWTCISVLIINRNQSKFFVNYE